MHLSALDHVRRTTSILLEIAATIPRMFMVNGTSVILQKERFGTTGPTYR